MFLLVLVGLLVYLIYSSLIKPVFYWKNKGIYYTKPWDRFVKVFLSNKSFVESVENAYIEFGNRRYVGSYQFLQPSLLVNDLDLIKQITVKDFDHFPNHLGFSSEKNDPIFGLNLFSLKGQTWRNMRATLSPAFTSSKMKSMFVLIVEEAEKFTQHFYQMEDDIIELEMKEAYTRFTNDVIASCAFGIKVDSLKDKNNEFFVKGGGITRFRLLAALATSLFLMFPKFFELLRIPLMPKSTTDFFLKIVKDTISHREQENIIRPDMIHLLMEARKGRLKHEKQLDTAAGFSTVEESNIGKSDITNFEITDNLITAQALVFFLAGFETSSTVMSFLSHELAVNPHIQKKLQQEIDTSLANSGGKITYEEILKMKYLDQVVSETLRRYPPGYVMNRECVKDYKIPAKYTNENDVIIEKGCLIAIPVYGIHNDPKYYPNPHVFDPERFNDENRTKIVAGSYLPFGSGPRNCIGSRFALLEIKALVVTLFSKFEIVTTKKTAVPLRLAKSLNIAVQDGFWLGLKKRPKRQ